MEAQSLGSWQQREGEGEVSSSSPKVSGSHRKGVNCEGAGRGSPLGMDSYHTTGIDQPRGMNSFLDAEI